jgi:hypothetical protein
LSGKRLWTADTIIKDSASSYTATDEDGRYSPDPLQNDVVMQTMSLPTAILLCLLLSGAAQSNPVLPSSHRPTRDDIDAATLHQLQTEAAKGVPSQCNT